MLYLKVILNANVREKTFLYADTNKYDNTKTNDILKTTCVKLTFTEIAQSKVNYPNTNQTLNLRNNTNLKPA